MGCTRAETPMPTPAPVQIRVTSDAAALPLMRALTDAYAAAQPNTNFVLEWGNAPAVMEAMRLGRAQLGIVSVLPSTINQGTDNRNKLWFTDLATDSLVVIVNSQNKLNNLSTFELREIYADRAERRYGLSEVSQLEHALQAATLAQANGYAPSLIAAALLHDIGHMVHDLGENPAAEGVDDVHEDTGADWLAQFFPPDVTEPVRLHVAAKRYLCTTEADYFAKLSADSVRSLALQGGKMSAEELAAFKKQPSAMDAVLLRRLDEQAKDPNAVTPTFDDFLPLLIKTLRP